MKNMRFYLLMHSLSCKVVWVRKGKMYKIQYLQCPVDGDIAYFLAEIKCCRKS